MTSGSRGAVAGRVAQAEISAVKKERKETRVSEKNWRKNGPARPAERSTPDLPLWGKARKKGRHRQGTHDPNATDGSEG